MVSQSSFASTGAGSRIGFLTRPNEGRFVVQDFARFPESLEWELGEAYLSTKGFVQDKIPIPWAINNDGTLSTNAAEVLFQSLRQAEETGSLEGDIFVLELWALGSACSRGSFSPPASGRSTRCPWPCRANRAS
jgi:hypothetical protein